MVAISPVEIVVPSWFWIIFHGIIVTFIAIDLRWGDRHKPTLKSAATWFSIWVLIAVIFGIWIFKQFGYLAGTLYFTAYVVEKVMSMDNLFVFAIIFTYFAVPLEYQRKTLYVGILTAIVLRALFIAVGIAVLEAWRPVIYVFAVVLFYTGLKLLRAKRISVEPERNPLIRFVKKHFPLTTYFDEDKFVIRKNGMLFFTPLVLALILIGTSDIMFAFDSIPAVIAITENFLLAYTSNIMAILGLRSFYFFVAILMFKLRYLGKGLSAALIFLGTKIIVTELHILEIPTLASVLIILSIIAVSAISSIYGKKRNRAE